MNKLQNLGRVLTRKTLSESATGKKAGAVNMVLATLEWEQGGALSMAKVRRALGQAYDAGYEDGVKDEHKKQSTV